MVYPLYMLYTRYIFAYKSRFDVYISETGGLEKMSWILTDHLKEQLEEREIPKEFVFDALNNPDEVVEGDKGRNIYHKMIRGKLLRVVVKTNVVITVYHTSKIGKYWKGK